MALAAIVAVFFQELSPMNILVAIFALGMLNLERSCERALCAVRMTLLTLHRCVSSTKLE
jgi:hypothetical protein